MAKWDIFVYSYVSRDAIQSIMDDGLYSGKALLNRPDLLELAAKSRNISSTKLKNKINKALKDNFSRPAVLGPNAVFQLIPNLNMVSKKHPVFKNKLIPIKINLTQLLADHPDISIFGMELKPYQEGMQDGERHHYLSNKELKQYLAMSAKELWKLYNDIDDRGLYAPDVPHISIHTKNGIIPPEYLKEIKKANSNMISNLLKWSNTFYKLASELSSLEARKILGIEENDKLEDIRQKYKALSKKHHPDVGGDPAIQSKINEAYKIILLTNPERKNLDGILVNINQSDPSARDHRMTGFSKSFTNPVEARNFIIEYVGDPPADFGNFGRPYAVSEDGQTKVTIDGITWKDLFPNESFWWTEEDFEVFEKEYEQDRHSFNTMVENNPGAFSDEMADELQRLKQERKNKIPKNRRLEEIAGGASEREIMNQRHRLEKARLPPEEDDGILF